MELRDFFLNIICNRRFSDIHFQNAPLFFLQSCQTIENLSNLLVKLRGTSCPFLVEGPNGMSHWYNDGALVVWRLKH